MEPDQQLIINCNTLKQEKNFVSQGINVTENDIQKEYLTSQGSNLRLKSVGIQTERNGDGKSNHQRIIYPNTAVPQTSQEAEIASGFSCKNGSSFQVLSSVMHFNTTMLGLTLQNANAVLNIPEVSTVKDGILSSKLPLVIESRSDLWRSCRDASRGKSTELLTELKEESSDDSDSDRPYRCSVCKKSYLEKHHLKRHMMIHSGERPFQCFLCSKSFTQKSHLERHVFVHSKWSDSSKCDDSILTDVSNFKPNGGQCNTNRNATPVKDSADDITSRQCSECHKVFINRYHLRRHALIHLGVRPFQCHLCSKSFTQKEHLQRHILTHSVSSDVVDISANTGLSAEAVSSAPVEQNVNQGRVMVGKVETKPSEENSDSSVSDSSSSQNQLVQNHMLITEERPFNLALHLGAQAPADIKQEPVSSKDVESAVQSSENGETATLNRESEDENMAMSCNYQSTDFCNQCSVCQKAFASKYHLRRHLLIHSGERPYQCPICLKSFNQREHVERHVRTHSFLTSGECNTDAYAVPVEEEHLNVSSPVSTIKVECVLECDNSEESSTSSNGNVEQVNEVIHQCTICNKILSNKYHLKRHMLIHSGERPFQCQMCPKNFTQKCHLERHMFTHSALRCGVARDSAMSPLKIPEIQTNIPTTFEFFKAITESPTGFSTVSAESLLSGTVDVNTAEVCPANVGKMPLVHVNAENKLQSENSPDVEQENKSFTGARHFLEDVICLSSAEPAADGDSEDSGNNRPYECSFCHKTFIQKHHLKRHLMIHNNERPFQCLQCGKAFNQKQHLEKHTINKSCTKPVNNPEEDCNMLFDSKEKALTGTRSNDANSSEVSAQLDTIESTLDVDKCNGNIGMKDPIVYTNEEHSEVNSSVESSDRTRFLNEAAKFNHREETKLCTHSVGAQQVNGDSLNSCNVVKNQCFSEQTNVNNDNSSSCTARAVSLELCHLICKTSENM